ncbi:MAG: radical SAM protein [Promethearchaeota archaeon]|nr:MAG: radical SAM protein [Candidatus Lokiarchaeota archaeon]
MTTNEIKSIISQIAELGTPSLSFTGGEPTLREDLPELINFSGVQKKLITGLATNGQELPKLLKENHLRGLDYILISLDFPSAELHDSLRGMPLFNKVIQSIKIAKKKGIKVIISTNVMKSNISYLPEICELAQRLECSIELFPCEHLPFSTSGGNMINSFKVNDLIPNLKLWGKTVRALRVHYNNILTNSYCINLIENGGFGRVQRRKNILECYVAETYLFVRSDGMVNFPCKIHPIVSFSALKIPLKKILNSKKVEEIRKKHDGFEFCKDCRLGCAITSSMTAKWGTIYEKYIKNFLRGNL